MNHPNEAGNVPIILAVTNGYAEIVKVLISADADKDFQDRDGKSALSHAAYHGYVDIVEILIESNCKIDLENKKGQTALSIAAQNKHIKVVKMLLAAGADINSQTTDGKSALTYADLSGNFELVKLLLEMGAKDQLQTKGSTFYISRECVRQNRLEMNPLLLLAAEMAAGGDDIKVLTNKGTLCSLSNATRTSYIEIVKVLLSYDPEPVSEPEPEDLGSISDIDT